MDLIIPLYRSTGTNSNKKEGCLYPFLGINNDSAPEIAKFLCETVAGTNLQDVGVNWIMKSPFYAEHKKEVPGITTYIPGENKENHPTYGYGYTHNSKVLKNFAFACETFNGEVKSIVNHYEFTKRLNSVIDGTDESNMKKLFVLTLATIGINANLNILKI